LRKKNQGGVGGPESYSVDKWGGKVEGRSKVELQDIVRHYFKRWAGGPKFGGVGFKAKKGQIKLPHKRGSDRGDGDVGTGLMRAKKMKLGKAKLFRWKERCRGGTTPWRGASLTPENLKWQRRGGVPRREKNVWRPNTPKEPGKIAVESPNHRRSKKGSKGKKKNKRTQNVKFRRRVKKREVKGDRPTPMGFLGGKMVLKKKKGGKRKSSSKGRTLSPKKKKETTDGKKKLRRNSEPTALKGRNRKRMGGKS